MSTDKLAHGAAFARAVSRARPRLAPLGLADLEDHAAASPADALAHLIDTAGNDTTVAELLGVTRRTVLRWRQALDVSAATPCPTYTEQQKADAVATYLDGLPGHRVAAQIGAHRHTVLAWVRAAGHQPRLGASGHPDGCTCAAHRQATR